ncbi:MAG: outer membrane protein assembly factor BamD [Rhodocyclaceae bacterium]|nr:MAG: outer membrane protein assembly factor BamD [Rhodocyclaceae bacterium]
MRSVAAVAVSFALLLSFLLGGCGLLADKDEEEASWTAQKLYTEAKESMNDGGYDRAIKLFEKLEAKYPYGRYAQQAQLEVAYANFKLQDIASTVSACERFIRLHPNHPNVDYAYYLKGLANFGEDQGYIAELTLQDLSERDAKAARDSFDAFKELATKFPASRYTPDATARMNYLVNNLASHQVHVATYYFKRGAYLAAVSRAQASLKSFPGAPANEEALYIIVRAYDALGLNDLRDDSERVMRRNFPNSEFFARGLYRTEPWWKLW